MVFDSGFDIEIFVTEIFKFQKYSQNFFFGFEIRQEKKIVDVESHGVVAA